MSSSLRFLIFLAIFEGTFGGYTVSPQELIEFPLNYGAAIAMRNCARLPPALLFCLLVLLWFFF
jgi:hypothetical protein